MSRMPGRISVRGSITTEKDDVVVIDDTEIYNFEGVIQVIDEGGGKATIFVKDTFADALFDHCTPLFDMDENCNVVLLEECG